MAASSRRAASKAGGNSRPRFSARRRIPRAAFGLKKYFADTRFCRTADKEHATAALGDSEIAAVQNPVADDRPALPKSREDGPHIGSPAAAKKPWNILEESPRRLDDLGDADDLPEEARAFALESGPLPSDGEVLAGEAAGEQIRPAPAVIERCDSHISLLLN